MRSEGVLSRWLATMAALAAVGCSSSETPSGPRASDQCIGDACDAGSAGSTGGGGGSGSSGSGGGLTDAPPIARDPLCPVTNDHINVPVGLVRDGIELVSTGPVADHNGVYIAANDSYLVWANDLKFRRIEVATGAEVAILDRESTFFRTLEGIVIDNGLLYVDDASFDPPHGIWRVPLDLSSSPQMVVDARSTYLLTIADGYFYYFDFDLQGIARTPIGGGTPTVLVRDVDPTGLTVGGGYLYFIHPRANSFDVHLLRIPITARAPDPDAGRVDTDAAPSNIPPGTTDLGTVSNTRTSPAVADAVNVYWGDHDKVFMLPHSGGTPKVIGQATDAPGGPFPADPQVGSVITTGDAVYWTQTSFGCPNIVKSSPAGGSQTMIAKNVASPSQLVHSGSYLYFVLEGDKIFRVAR